MNFKSILNYIGLGLIKAVCYEIDDVNVNEFVYFSLFMNPTGGQQQSYCKFCYWVAFGSFSPKMLLSHSILVVYIFLLEFKNGGSSKDELMWLGKVPNSYNLCDYYLVENYSMFFLV
jgi:hypothetical protein